MRIPRRATIFVTTTIHSYPFPRSSRSIPAFLLKGVRISFWYRCRSRDSADEGLKNSMSNANIVLPPGRKQMGLPEHAVVVQVLHNRSANQTIVEVQSEKGSPIHRLYWRRAGEAFYLPLGNPEPDVSLEQAVTGEHPFVYACATQWRLSSNPVAGSVRGIWRADLTDPPSMRVLDLAETVPANAHVTKLLRSNDSGTSLVAIVAFRQEGPVKYSVCALDLANKTTIELDVLPGIFF